MKNNYSNIRGCLGKTKHKTYAAALKEKPKNRKGDLNIYKCKACGFYHIGHINNYAKGKDQRK